MKDAPRLLPLIQMQSVCKVFEAGSIETHAVEAVDLVVERGEYISICGPSGCGKTTLLSIIGLLETPTSGRYLLKGHPVDSLCAADMARIRNREIGFVFQNFNLIGNLTVWENVELPLCYRGLAAAERRARVAEALARVKMAHRDDHYPSQLSGGQQQRVAIARALAGRPSILLCDEPTGNLDSSNAKAVMDMLDELHQGGTTICMVSHDPLFAARSERQIHLFDGRLAGVETLQRS